MIGAGIWNLLAEPASPREAAEAIAAAFPDADPSIIEADVAALFAALAAEGYILPDEGGAANA